MHERIKNNLKLKIINATWQPHGYAKHLERRLTKDAVYLDVERVVDTKSSLTLAVPTLDQFIEHAKRLQISADDHVVCYDDFGVVSAPRVAWMLRYFGVKDVQVLNGGLKKWLALGHDVYSGPQDIPLKSSLNLDFKIDRPKSLITELNDVH